MLQGIVVLLITLWQFGAFVYHFCAFVGFVTIWGWFGLSFQDLIDLGLWINDTIEWVVGFLEDHAELVGLLQQLL